MTGTRLANAGTGHHPASRGNASHQRSRLRWIALTGLIPVLYTGGAALAVVLLLAAAAAPEIDNLASFRRLLKRESSPTALLALVALTPVVDALLVAGMTMPVPAQVVFSALVAAGWLVACIKVLRLN